MLCCCVEVVCETTQDRFKFNATIKNGCFSIKQEKAFPNIKKNLTKNGIEYAIVFVVVLCCVWLVLAFSGQIVMISFSWLGVKIWR